VLYWLGEDALSDSVDRVDALLKGRGLDRDALGERLFMTEAPPTLDDRATQLRILDAVGSIRPTLMVVDPLARFLSDTDENSAKEMRGFNNWVRHDLTRTARVAVCVIHHTDKSGRNLRGSGDIRGLSEVTLKLREPDAAGRCLVKTEMRRGKAPEDFHFRLVIDEGVASIESTIEPARSSGRIERMRGYLKSCGKQGTTQDAARVAVQIRSADARKVLQQAGAVLGYSGRWMLPEFADAALPPASSRGGKDPVPRDFSAARKTGKGVAAKLTGAEGFDSSRTPEVPGRPAVVLLPSPGGLVEAPGRGA
jgi:hypothetical protein